MSNTKIPIIPLIEPGTYDWHYGDDRDKWITYTYTLNENSGVRTVTLSGNSRIITQNTGTYVHNNVTNYDYIFFPIDTNPLSLSAVEQNKSFSINIKTTESSKGKWFIRIVDKKGILKMCGGIPLENGVTTLYTNYSNGVLVPNPPSTFTFRDNMVEIPPYTSAYVSGNYIPITKSRAKTVKGEYIKDYYKELRAGNNIFDVPRGGQIRLWNLCDKLNSPQKAIYNITQASYNTEKLIMYGNLNSIKNHSYDVDETISGVVRIQYMQPGEFYGLFSGFTDLQKVDMGSLPHYVESGILPEYYCANMFAGCTSLREGVGFNSSLQDDLSCGTGCFQNMFAGCTSLSTFNGRLYGHYTAAGAYNGMFSGCTTLSSFSLEIDTSDAPDDTKRQYTYANMFKGCISLNNPTVILNINNSIGVGCFSHMFDGCTNLINSPSFSDPAGNTYNFSEHCFNSMFANTKIEEINLFNTFNPQEYQPYCCYGMFSGCSRLFLGTVTPVYVPGSQTVIPGGGGWVYGIGYPDYAALAVDKKTGATGSVTIANGGWVRISLPAENSNTGSFSVTINGKSVTLYGFRTGNCGYTWILPVPVNSHVSWSGGNAGTSVGYAPSMGGILGFPDFNALAGNDSNMTAGQSKTITNDGWLRISVLHNRNLENGCVRLYQDVVANSSNPHVCLHKYSLNSPGATYLIPVKGGHSYTVNIEDTTSYTLKYAASVGGIVNYPNYSFGDRYIGEDENFPVPADGWVQIVCDYGACIRFVVGDVSWDYQFPLYSGYGSSSQGCQISFFIPVKAGWNIKFHFANDYCDGEMYYSASPVGYGTIYDEGHWQEGDSTTIITPDRWTPGDWDDIPQLGSVQGFDTSSCESMFEGCTRLQATPVFKSSIVLKSGSQNVFKNTFKSCTNLKYAKWNSASISINNTNQFNGFISNNSQTGYLFTSNSSDQSSVATTIIPASWGKWPNT